VRAPLRVQEILGGTVSVSVEKGLLFPVLVDTTAFENRNVSKN